MGNGALAAPSAFETVEEALAAGHTQEEVAAYMAAKMLTPDEDWKAAAASLGFTEPSRSKAPGGFDTDAATYKIESAAKAGLALSIKRIENKPKDALGSVPVGRSFRRCAGRAALELPAALPPHSRRARFRRRSPQPTRTSAPRTGSGSTPPTRRSGCRPSQSCSPSAA